MSRKIVLVLGGVKGLGRYLSEFLIEKNYKVIVASLMDKKDVGHILIHYLSDGRHNLFTCDKIISQIDLTKSDLGEELKDLFFSSLLTGDNRIVEDYPLVHVWIQKNFKFSAEELGEKLRDILIEAKSKGDTRSYTWQHSIYDWIIENFGQLS